MPYDIESQSRNASCVPFRGRGPRSGEGVDGGKNDYDILILCLIALKGKRLTTFCASLALLHPLLSLTHWIFGSLMLPYKSSSHSAPTAVTDSLDFQVADAPLQIQFASAKCVRCASLRSGGRRLAVRTAKEYPIGALPCTPFPASRDFPSRGNERYEGKNSESYTSGTISAFSPFGGWRHHLARWEACHLILSRLRLLANPVPLPPGGKHVI